MGPATVAARVGVKRLMLGHVLAGLVDTILVSDAVAIISVVTAAWISIAAVAATRVSVAAVTAAGITVPATGVT